MNQPATMPRAFVLGHPIAHSRSPMLHGFWLRSLRLAGSYEAVDVAPGQLNGFFERLRNEGFAGGNVTVPHKLAVMKHVSRLDDAASAIGAVNTIWQEAGAWVGGNTDAAGFLGNLDEGAPGWDSGGRTAVILGAGGAARAAVYALKSRGFTVHLVNRTLAHAADIAEHFGEGIFAHDWDRLAALMPGAGLLVNTTALGMQGKPPLEIDLAPLGPDAIVHDIVYAPLQTQLLQAARARGLRSVDGLGMLLHQAVPGFAHWFGVTPKVTPELRALLEADIRARS